MKTFLNRPEQGVKAVKADPVLTIASLCLSFVAIGWAQTPTAQIHGIVLDSQGSVIPSARVVANNELTGEEFTAQSNDTGWYLLRSLPIGNYALAAEVSGFKRYTRTGISLSGGQVARVDVKLEIGSVSESVNVTAALPPVDTSTSTLSTLVDSRRMKDLPLNGRNVLELAALMPGATRVASSLMGEQQINVNGNRASSTDVTLDGAGMYNGHRGQAMVQPPPDSIQEIKVVTSGLGAEYGRGTAQVSVITKSGSNQFHGSLWDYLRNDKLDARSFFAADVSKLRYNQFGGSIGGPIRRDKAFFFATYERLEIRQDNVASSAFPLTEAERSGDFSASRDARPTDPLNQQLFPGGIIPASRRDPVAQKLLERMRVPNRPDGRYIVQAPGALTKDILLVRGVGGARSDYRPLLLESRQSGPALSTWQQRRRLFSG
jgi:hypothetical protein